ncbi:DUF2293 domain-containing protein [Dethiobacter alkaliphilus]|uniref:Conserved hypothetical arginine and alanine rich protein n=1 Tax=Dethiobacter alkaliphilus AHT 1 TaxID=555088 RepID=C0GE72_DETAL|nr:DUF2293 domain-containing protein [Dethiobacter alkaliphilus]EEG78366.1 conserved hypothetical arginine and alanine rich protein [Dethiobacter alkaliphilus AHT 1]
MSKINVYHCNRETSCIECEVEIIKGDFLFISEDRKHLCLSCADLDHLIFLPSGNTALTRRAGKYSKLQAVVLKFSSARKRNERQGVLVEQSALEKAEQECMSDEGAREQRRQRESIRREKLDKQYVQEFATKIRELYPNCPEEKEHQIAEHACLKHSGRVGRSANAKQLDRDFIDLAVIAHVRHHATPYDELLMSGYDRQDARRRVKDAIDEVISSWS